MTKTNRFKYTTLRFLKGNLSETEEIELLGSIKSGEYHQSHFLKDQDSWEDNVINSKSKATDKAWAGFLKLNKLPAKTRQKHRFILERNEIRSVAAAFIIGILITSAFFVLYYSPFNSNTDFREIYIPLGAKSKIELPDGSSVWLNSGTKISYPGMYRDKREVTLNGEAYFEVVKSNIPFCVNTVKGKIEVLGTAFNVQCFSSEDFKTTLVSGSVKLTGIGGKTVLLKPGEQAGISQSGELAVSRVDTDSYTSWKEGKLIFSREPFYIMAQRLERWYNVKIVIADEELRNLWFTGNVEIETLTEFMALIEQTYPIKYSYDQKNKILRLEKKK